MALTSATCKPVEAKDPTLQEILAALSFALDLTGGAVPGHAIRSSLLAVRIAHEIGLDHAAVSDLYYASLLKDVGCSSNSALMCQIVGGDDRIVKAGVKLDDWTRPLTPKPSTVKLLWQQVLPGASPLKKAARLAKMAATQHRNNRDLIALRCDRGAMIVRKLGLGIPIAIAVRHLDEHWDGGGYPSGLKGCAIPILSRLMCVAQHLDAFCMQHGPQVALDTLVRRSRRWFDPQLTAAAVALGHSSRLWTNCLPDDPVQETRTAILHLNPERQTHLSALDIDAICETFADVVDAKSPFTYRHSLGVMDAAVAIAHVLGLAPSRIRLIRRAALLHDVGKLSISNAILDKPTRLSARRYSATSPPSVKSPSSPENTTRRSTAPAIPTGFAAPTSPSNRGSSPSPTSSARSPRSAHTAKPAAPLRSPPSWTAKLSPSSTRPATTHSAPSWQDSLPSINSTRNPRTSASSCPAST
jgi:HD-GYP domain-containing protein (c-di-GMP phosphodiesterase class II)